MPYLLDANAVIALLENRSANLVSHVRQHAVSDIAISAIVLHELYFGAFKSRRVTGNVQRVNALRFEVLQFDTEDAPTPAKSEPCWSLRARRSVRMTC